MPLDTLHQGIPVPEHSVTLPWLISKRPLYEYIPRSHFRFHPGSWPKLEFTCLGITAEFGFNFVSHPDGKLVKIELIVDDLDVHVETIDGVPTQLLDHLGQPRRRDTHIFRWWDDVVVVDCSVAISRRQPDEPKVYWLASLEICYSAGLRSHWNHPSTRKHLPGPLPG